MATVKHSPTPGADHHLRSRRKKCLQYPAYLELSVLFFVAFFFVLLYPSSVLVWSRFGLRGPRDPKSNN